jgi:hypothetical protein
VPVIMVPVIMVPVILGNFVISGSSLWCVCGPLWYPTKQESNIPFI